MEVIIAVTVHAISRWIQFLCGRTFGRWGTVVDFVDRDALVRSRRTKFHDAVAGNCAFFDNTVESIIDQVLCFVAGQNSSWTLLCATPSIDFATRIYSQAAARVESGIRYEPATDGIDERDDYELTPSEYYLRID